MRDYLTFTLYAPLASWGDVAVGEVRESLDRPTRSAVLGLLAAAIGLEREQEEKHAALESGYGLAIHARSTGLPLLDYHTTQSVAASYVKKLRPGTRKELLECAEPGTILSQRTLRTDALAIVAIWGHPRAEWSLQEIKAALERPAFVLYAGRKANPLGLPLGPQVHSAARLLDVFDAELKRQEGIEALRSLRPGGGRWGDEVWYDDPQSGPLKLSEDERAGLTHTRRLTRRDAVLHRGRWQFAEHEWQVGIFAREAT